MLRWDIDRLMRETVSLRERNAVALALLGVLALLVASHGLGWPQWAKVVSYVCCGIWAAIVVPRGLVREYRLFRYGLEQSGANAP